MPFYITFLNSFWDFLNFFFFFLFIADGVNVRRWEGAHIRGTGTRRRWKSAPPSSASYRPQTTINGVPSRSWSMNSAPVSSCSNWRSRRGRWSSAGPITAALPNVSTRPPPAAPPRTRTLLPASRRRKAAIRPNTTARLSPRSNISPTLIR